MKGAFRTAAMGRYKAFKHWLTKAWSGKSDLQTIIGDYEDYLSLFEPESKEARLSLHEYFDATRAPGDDGHYEQYAKIMNKMGQTGDRKHYIEIRQDSRNKKLAAQHA